MSHVPNWYESLLLALAAYRIFRIAAWDDITEPARLRLVRYAQKGYRERLATFIQCPHCLGFWVSIGIYLLWLWIPTATLVVATPFALSAIVGILGHLLHEH